MKFIAQKDIIYNMDDKSVESINVIEENTVSGDIDIHYRRPKFAHRVLANLIDLILFAIAFIGLFSLSRYVVSLTPHHSQTFATVNQMRIDSGLYREENGQMMDIVSYMNTSNVLTNEGKVVLSEYSIKKFLAFEKDYLSDERYKSMCDKYDTDRLDKTYVEQSTTYHLFIKNTDNEIVKDESFYEGHKYVYRDFYLNYIDKVFQGYFSTTPAYYEATRILFFYLVFLDVPVSILLSIFLVYYVPTLFFRRGRKTLGKALYRIGTVDTRFLSPKFGRNTARWALFLLEIILGIASLGVIFILSFTMMAFSKNKQGFPDYILGLQEIDTSSNKIYLTYEEIELNDVERHKRPTDFRLIQRP